MKKILAGAVLISASMSSFAVSPGGPDCGWGNMLFKGQSGLPQHVIANITNNASTGNATFGMSSGTNGCSTTGTLTYGGQALVGVFDEFSEDAARGEGDALTAVAVSYGIEKHDRDAFAALVHDNFASLFPNANVTAAEVHQQIVDLMRADARLSKYVS